MNRFILWLALPLFFLTPALFAQPEFLTVPNPSFVFHDQKKAAGNACGPTSLLNSFGSGSEPYQAVFAKVPGSIERARIASVIKSWGYKPSVRIPSRQRWQNKSGIGFDDLTQMAEEMSALHWQARKPTSELVFPSKLSKHPKAVRSTHKALAKSMRKGFAPVLSIRRFVYRDGQWQSVHGHFVTLTAVPEKLGRREQFFTLRYLDPLGAKTKTARLQSANLQGFPCLMLVGKELDTGLPQVRSGEPNALAFAGYIAVR